MSAEIVPVIEATLVPGSPLDPLDAFEWFLQVDVANGDATHDTVVAYRREVDGFLNWCRQNGHEPLQITRNEIERFREDLKLQGLAMATRAQKLSIVRRFYAAAVRHDLMAKNPAEGVRGGRDLTAPEDKIRALSQFNLASLVALMPNENLADTRDRAIIGLMALHGLRRIETHRLNHEDLHLDDEGAPFLDVLGKGNKKRRVYLRADTLAALENYANAKLGAELSLSGAFFVSHSNNATGKRLSRQALNEIVAKHLSAANLKKAGISCHALRHTFGTLAVAGGAKIEHLRDAMGHSKIETTSIYVRAVEKAKNNPANFIEVEL